MTTLILPEACINKPKEFHSDKWLEQSKFCSLCREECTHEKHHRYKDISWKEIYRWETKTGRKKSEECWGDTFRAEYLIATDPKEFHPETPEHVFSTRMIWSSITRQFGIMPDHSQISGPDEGKDEFTSDLNKYLPIVADITTNTSLFHTDDMNWQLLIDEGGIRISALAHGGGYMYLNGVRY